MSTTRQAVFLFLHRGHLMFHAGTSVGKTPVYEMQSRSAKRPFVCDLFRKSKA